MRGILGISVAVMVLATGCASAPDASGEPAPVLSSVVPIALDGSAAGLDGASTPATTSAPPTAPPAVSPASTAPPEATRPATTRPATAQASVGAPTSTAATSTGPTSTGPASTTTQPGGPAEAAAAPSNGLVPAFFAFNVSKIDPCPTNGTARTGQVTISWEVLGAESVSVAIDNVDRPVTTGLPPAGSIVLAHNCPGGATYYVVAENPEGRTFKDATRP